MTPCGAERPGALMRKPRITRRARIERIMAIILMYYRVPGIME